jgi:hypothetical protein
MLEVTPDNVTRIEEYLSTVTPILFVKPIEKSEEGVVRTADAVEIFKIALKDVQQEELKKKDHYRYSKAYLIVNYLNWLINHYSLEELKNFRNCCTYYNSALTSSPTCCIVGAAFNDPISFPFSLRGEKWEDVRDVILDEGDEFDCSNILPVCLLNQDAVYEAQEINDNSYVLRDLIEELLHDYYVYL